MNSDIKIITLPISRWQEYKRLRLEALEKEAHAFGAKHSETKIKPDEEWIDRVKASGEENRDIMLFAEDNDQLVGMIGAYFNKSKENQGIANIWGFYVNKRYRGKGAGKKLITEVVERIKTKKDLKKIRLYVNQEQKPAVNLYKQLGFVVIAAENFVLGDGIDHNEYIMELNIEQPL